jgi:peptide/nickel transport system substrate-binding protein
VTKDIVSDEGTSRQNLAERSAPEVAAGHQRATTRRRVLQGALASSVLPLVPAAGRVARSAPASARPATQAAGGQIVFANTSEPTTLNPAFSPISTVIYFSQFLFDGLTRPDDNLRPAPSLAESWEVGEDGLSYTFHLREGVTFHDGGDLTSEDVKFTWELISHPSNAAGAQIYGFFDRIKGAEAYRAGEAEEIAGITLPDPLTVQVEMEAVYAPFLSISAFQPILSKAAYSVVPMEELMEHETARNPIGTGPFKLAEWRPNEHLALDANLEYWAGRPKADRLLVQTIPEYATMVSNLRAGSVDIIGMHTGLNPIDYPSFAEDPNFHVLEFSGAWNRYVEFNLRNPLFQDVLVRRAMVHAIDREGIVQNLLLGHGQVIDSPISPTSWAYTEPDTNYDYDPARASELLAEAGWTPGADGILEKDGQRFEFTTLTFTSFMEDYPVIMQEQWRQVGINTTLEPGEFAAIWGPRYLAGDFDVFAIHQVFGIYTDPTYSLGGYFASDLNRNDYENPEVDRLIEAATATVDEEERKQLYAELQELLVQDAAHFFVVSPNEIWGTTARIRMPDKNLGFLMYTNVKDWEIVQ